MYSAIKCHSRSWGLDIVWVLVNCESVKRIFKSTDTLRFTLSRVLLSVLHPRLFTSLALIEPVISPDIFTGQGPILAMMSLKRRDMWKSKSEAIKAAKEAYKAWNTRTISTYEEGLKR